MNLTEVSKTGRRIKVFILSFVLILHIITSMFPASVLAAGYSSDYRLWSQGCSAYADMRDSGCLIVAQAKLIYEAGLDRSDSFNPDTYYNWLRSSKFLLSNSIMQTGGGKAVSAYASTKDKSLNFLGTTSYDVTNKIWDNIKSGYYTIIKVVTPSGGTHFVMVANELSRQNREIYCYNSDGSANPAQPTPIATKGYKITLVYTYSSPSAISLENGYFGYSDSKTENSLLLHGKIVKPSGVVIDSFGMRIASAKEDWENGHTETVICDSENIDDTALHMIFDTADFENTDLTHATEYKYQFFATANGGITWSKEATVSTAGSHSFDEWTVLKTASCTQEGSRARKCFICGANDLKAIAKTSHRFSEWKILKPASELKAGEMERICTACSFTETNEIPILAKPEEPIPEIEEAKPEPTPEEDCNATADTSQKIESSFSIPVTVISLSAVCILISFCIYFSFFKNRI